MVALSGPCPRAINPSLASSWEHELSLPLPPKSSAPLIPFKQKGLQPFQLRPEGTTHGRAGKKKTRRSTSRERGLPWWVSQQWVVIAILAWDLVQPEPPSTSPRNDVIWRRWIWAPRPIRCHQEGGKGQPKVVAPPWGLLKAGRPIHLVPNQGTGWCPRCLRHRVTSWSLMVLSQGFAQPSPKSKQPHV